MTHTTRAPPDLGVNVAEAHREGRNESQVHCLSKRNLVEAFDHDRCGDDDGRDDDQRARELAQEIDVSRDEISHHPLSPGAASAALMPARRPTARENAPVLHPGAQSFS
jgi:hypothetical protein